MGEGVRYNAENLFSFRSSMAAFFLLFVEKKSADCAHGARSADLAEMIGASNQTFKPELFTVSSLQRNQ